MQPLQQTFADRPPGPHAIWSGDVLRKILIVYRSTNSRGRGALQNFRDRKTAAYGCARYDRLTREPNTLATVRVDMSNVCYEQRKQKHFLYFNFRNNTKSVIRTCCIYYELDSIF